MASPTRKQVAYLEARGIMVPETKKYTTCLIGYLKKGVPGCRMSMSESESDRIGRTVAVQNRYVGNEVKILDEVPNAITFSYMRKLQGKMVTCLYVYSIPINQGWKHPYGDPVMVRAEIEVENDETIERGIPVPCFELYEQVRG